MSRRSPLAEQIRAGLRAAAQPAKAEPMRAYLRSDLPCLGTYSKDRRAAVRAGLAQHEPDRTTWLAAIDDLWTRPAFREERQAAIDLLTERRTRAFRDVTALDLCQRLIVEGAWWDLVDGTAAAVNDVLDRYRDEATPLMYAWSTDGDMWLRRVSITCQLRSKDATDLELLTSAIDASATSDEFFLRKAIGWALRSYARTDPDWVREFVRAREGTLSALSVREATKHL